MQNKIGIGSSVLLLEYYLLHQGRKRRTPNEMHQSYPEVMFIYFPPVPVCWPQYTVPRQKPPEHYTNALIFVDFILTVQS